MMSYRGSRGAVPSPVYKADPLSRLGRSRARISAGLEAELSYCICIAFVCVCVCCNCVSLHDSQRRACYAHGYYIGDEVNRNTAVAAPIGTVEPFYRDTDNWTYYCERLAQYFVWPMAFQNLLQSCLVHAVGQLIRSLVFPAKPTEKSFSEIQLVHAHLLLARLLLYNV